MSTLIGLTCFSVVILLAIYWTLWKVQGQLNQNWEKAISELSEIRKALAAKTDKT